jgi:predicted  nucleic acid-binding Zn-ribbon protein
MKREELEKLGLEKDAIDQIMALHGQTVEKHKTDLSAVKAEADALKTQLSEASKQIEGFKSLDIEGVRKQADEWKAKAEQAQTEAAQQVAKLKFDTALTGALSSAKAKNAKAVQALLDAANLKYNEADGSIIGLNEQLEKIKAENDYLFDSGTPTPRIVTSGNAPPSNTDALTAAMRAGAGLK